MGININNNKKYLGCIVDFLSLEFNILQIKAQLSKNNLKKAIKKVVKVLKKKSSTIYKKLQSLISFFSFAAKIICLGQAFF